MIRIQLIPKAQGPRPKAQGPRYKAQGSKPKAQGPNHLNLNGVDVVKAVAQLWSLTTSFSTGSRTKVAGCFCELWLATSVLDHVVFDVVRDRSCKSFPPKTLQLGKWGTSNTTWSGTKVVQLRSVTTSFLTWSRTEVAEPARARTAISNS